jgi:benzylsuccinate CoA-transferase BbsF subunit
MVDLLKGVRVADFTHALAGPTGSLILALMGAEVIKIESQAHSDVATRDPKHAKAQETMGIFYSTNLNKLSITLNLKRQEAVELAKKLIKICDIVIENYRPGVMDRLGLGYSVLQKIKPDLIMLSLSSHGAEGPERNYGAYAAIMGPLSGLSYVTGYGDGPPAPIRSNADSLAGTTAVLPILAALNYRLRTGRGQYIDHSAVESLSVCMGDILMEYTMNKKTRCRDTNRDDYMAPHNCYKCQGDDKWVSIAIGSEDEWQSFCKAIGNPRLSEDKRFKDPLVRWDNQEELDSLITEWTVKHTSYEVMEVLQKAGVAAVPSFTSEQLFNDPHCRRRDVYVEVNQPYMGRQVQTRLPWKSSSPMGTMRPVPLLGEHNEYVFCTLLGMTKEEMQKLEKEKIIF